jgi:hypothetical protein
MFYGMAILWTDWLPRSWLDWFLFGGVAVFGITSLIIWRCPACGALLGRSWHPGRCPECWVSLVEDRDRAV